MKKSSYEKTKAEFLLEGFENGFDIGYAGSSLVKQTAPNLKFIIGNETELWNKVMKEVKEKRYAGPFREIPFSSYIQSPIGLVPKDGGKKTRLIFHLSYPRNTGKSVNENTPEELKKVDYKSFDDAVRIIVSEGIYHVYLCKSDLAHAFRNLPISRRCWRYLVMKAKSPFDRKFYFFVDKCLPFGAAVSCQIFQALSDALSHIVTFFTGRLNINYLDDFLFIAFLKSLCEEQLTVFIEICHSIKFPISEEKTVWPTTRLEFLGLLLDTVSGMICLPVAKVERAKSMIQKMLKKGKTTLREMQQLTGFLNFLNKAVVPGRAFTRRLYACGSHLTQPHHHFNLKAEAKLDLKMWEAFLSNSDVYCRKMFDFSQKLYYHPVDFYTDASTSQGCGGYYKENWFICQWDEKFMLKNKPSINYLELYALTVAVISWAAEVRNQNQNVVIFCDNQSVISMVNNSTSSCRNCMVLIRLITLQCMLHNIRLKVKYVKSAENTYADLLSRNRYQDFRKLSRKYNRYFKGTPTPIPEYLWPMEKIWVVEDQNE